MWPQPDTQHCEPLGKSCCSAGRHTAPTVSVERHGSGSHSGSAPPPSLGEGQAGRFSLPPSQTALVLSLHQSCGLYHLEGHHSHRGQHVKCSVQGAPRLGCVHAAYPDLGTEEEWKFWAQLVLMGTHFGLSPGCFVLLGALFLRVCDMSSGGAHTYS